MMRISRCLSLGAIALLPVVAAAQNVATLGNIRITADEVKLIAAPGSPLSQRLAASEEALESILKEELVRRALLDEARAKNWDKQSEVARRIEQATNGVILSAYMESISQPPAEFPSENEVKSFYDANHDKIAMQPRYHLAQIFVARPAKAEEAAGASQRANGFASQARQAGADFAALARASSEDAQSRARGGDLDWIDEVNIAPEIRAVVRNMKPGEISDLIESTHGWHIVRVLEFKPGGPATFEQARAAVVNALRAQRASQIRRAYVDELLKKNPIYFDRAVLEKLRAQMK